VRGGVTARDGMGRFVSLIMTRLETARFVGAFAPEFADVAVPETEAGVLSTPLRTSFEAEEFTLELMKRRSAGS
jgi:hypothetical protein